MRPNSRRLPSVARPGAFVERTAPVGPAAAGPGQAAAVVAYGNDLPPRPAPPTPSAIGRPGP
ncbi:hypothetical protein AB0P15_34585 [Streptomyces sp. NPDC087917]|uniref:hypothetical protein n=1 Tax=unclassified Streptomyces TaxID=2593676 RepID=UPI00343C83E9